MTDEKMTVRICPPRRRRTSKTNPIMMLSKKRHILISEQAALNSFINEPDILAHINFFDGILFTGQMQYIYKNGVEIISEDMTDADDVIYSHIGKEFLRQLLKFGMYFWRLRRGADNGIYPEIPLEEGRLKYVRATQRVQWFPIDMHSHKLRTVTEPDKYILVKEVKPPDLIKNVFQSALQPILKYHERSMRLFDIAGQREEMKLRPTYYLQQGYPPVHGDDTKDMLDDLVLWYNDDIEHRDKTPHQHFREPVMLDSMVSEAQDEAMELMGAMGNQDTLMRDRVAVLMKRDETVAKMGVPFFAKLQTAMPDIFNPRRMTYVAEFGPSVHPEIIRHEKVDSRLVQQMHEHYVDKVNKQFGFMNIRNLDHTKLGSAMNIKTFNDNINSKKGQMEEMLTMCHRSVLQGLQDERYHTFERIRLNPNSYVNDMVLKELIDLVRDDQESVVRLLESATGMALSHILKSYLERHGESTEATEDPKSQMVPDGTDEQMTDDTSQTKGHTKPPEEGADK